LDYQDASRRDTREEKVLNPRHNVIRPNPKAAKIDRHDPETEHLDRYEINRKAELG
jgi:hypothetical protein